MPRLNHVKKARKARPEHGIEVGDSYYWWQFAFSPRSISKTPPRRSQLTRSEFYGTLWDMEDGQSELGLEDIETFAEEVRTFGQEQEEKIQNMPESLQDCDSAETLRERAEAMETWASELEDIAGRVDSCETDDEREELLDEFHGSGCEV